jgi:hypothetical protein
MNKWRPLKNALAVLLIGVAVLSSNGTGVDLKIPAPSSSVSSKVSSAAKLVTKKQDKIKFAIFNHIFSERISDYEIDTQKLQDIYVLAAKKYFGGELKDKYSELDVKLTELFKNLLGEDNKILSDTDKKLVSEHFSGLAYKLVR